MPSQPLRPCARSGCPTLVRKGRCDSCSTERTRPSAQERGYDGRWKRERKEHLRQYPLCAPCMRAGRTTAANTVDHIVPHRGDPVLMWDRRNWESSCHSCHSAKTAREDGGYGNQGKGSTPRNYVATGALRSGR